MARGAELSPRAPDALVTFLIEVSRSTSLKSEARRRGRSTKAKPQQEMPIHDEAMWIQRWRRRPRATHERHHLHKPVHGGAGRGVVSGE
jgi:hypothetical protein